MSNKRRRNNGFMRYAESQKKVYERRLGKKLSLQELMDVATDEWDAMNEEEKSYWRQYRPSSNERRTNRPPRESTKPKAAQSTLPDGNPFSKTHTGNSLDGNRSDTKLKQTFVQEIQTLINRFDDFSRQNWRDALYDKLVWSELDNNPEFFLQNPFVVLTVNAKVDFMECKAVPYEFLVIVLKTPHGQLIAERLIVAADNSFPKTCDFGVMSGLKTKLCDPDEIVDIIWKLTENSWRHSVLIPSCQFQAVTWSLTWIKQQRDLILERETTSIPITHLHCLEDFVVVTKKLFSMPRLPNILDCRVGLISSRDNLCPVHDDSFLPGVDCFLQVTDLACRYLLYHLKRVHEDGKYKPKFPVFPRPLPTVFTTDDVPASTPNVDSHMTTNIDACPEFNKFIGSPNVDHRICWITKHMCKQPSLLEELCNKVTEWLESSNEPSTSSVANDNSLSGWDDEDPESSGIRMHAFEYTNNEGVYDEVLDNMLDNHRMSC